MAMVLRFSMDMMADKRREMYNAAPRMRELQQHLGFPQPLVLVGSIGHTETRLETNYRFETVEQFGAVWSRMLEPAAREWRRSLAPYMVPGSGRWEMFTVKFDADIG